MEKLLGNINIQKDQSFSIIRIKNKKINQKKW